MALAKLRLPQVTGPVSVASRVANMHPEGLGEVLWSRSILRVAEFATPAKPCLLPTRPRRVPRSHLRSPCVRNPEKRLRVLESR